MTGLFFSFDGIDGVGKSTQMELFCEWLRDRGHDVVQCRDPGGTPLGETLRELILHRQDTPISPMAEMLLYMASRAQLVNDVIQPSLQAGKTIVSDRFLVSNVAYQGHAGGVRVTDVWAVGAVATEDIRPDLTLMLDMPVEQASSRLNRDLDRIEARGAEFLNRVRDGFLHEADRSPDRIAVIDAARDIDTIQTEIQGLASRVIEAKGLAEG
ncbi:MAG: dTMP kinase [Planctomycetaceae bacterium]|nr:dTMP kinase [Planctomycetales bacterium]MCB9873657.1 dTMP kinase [Planctomycetaceae bacterium]MCB9940909.1 dTMP kinase [Planctomycetaceae bacterium]